MTFITYALGASLLLILAAGAVAAWKLVTSPWGLLALLAVLSIRFFQVLSKRELDRTGGKTKVPSTLATRPGPVRVKGKTGRVLFLRRKNHG